MVEQVGLELEIPMTKENYLAADAQDAEHLFLHLAEQGWTKKFDPNTGALVGVKRETAHGPEVIDTDYGVCALEVALPPFATPDAAFTHWRHFKHDLLLPAVDHCHLNLLGYGNQPLSGQLKPLIANKGHYAIHPQMVPAELREWFLQNSPGLCSVQFNFELPKARLLTTLNTFFKLSPLLWAATANDSIAEGQPLPYHSQRYRTFRSIAAGQMRERFIVPQRPFATLCDYINRTWEMPIFEIIRETKALYPANRALTMNQFIAQGQADFYTLDGQLRQVEPTLDDLKLAIYFCWLDYRPKFFFKAITAAQLIAAVRAADDQALLELIDYTVLEIRPVSMLSHEEEAAWLHFLYLLAQNVERVTAVTDHWHHDDLLPTLDQTERHGLHQQLNGRSLGDIGLALLDRLPSTTQSGYGDSLQTIHRRFAERKAPSDDARTLLERGGLDAFLAHVRLH